MKPASKCTDIPPPTEGVVEKDITKKNIIYVSLFTSFASNAFSVRSGTQYELRYPTSKKSILLNSH
jgi:hypothetical protein